jgi:hypothetical protein
VDLARYPRLRAHLEAHRARLASRHVGKRQPERWYRTIDRVHAGLTARPKLYIADIKDHLNPVLDPGTTYPHHNLYVVHSATWDPEVLGGLLLSDVAQFFIECYAVRMRGGYLRFQAQYLRRIRVPRPHDLTPALRAAYTVGVWRNDADSDVEPYITRAGAPTFAHRPPSGSAPPRASVCPPAPAAANGSCPAGIRSSSARIRPMSSRALRGGIDGSPVSMRSARPSISAIARSAVAVASTSANSPAAMPSATATLIRAR